MGRTRENKGKGMSKGAKACHNMANLVKIQHVKAEYEKGKVGWGAWIISVQRLS